MVPSMDSVDPEAIRRLLAGRRAAAQAEPRLLARIKANETRLRRLLDACAEPGGGEDGFYRLYHESIKVHRLNGLTAEIVRELARMLPERELNPWFQRIVHEGKAAGQEAGEADPAGATGVDWFQRRRAVVEAYFHAHMFLQLAYRYGRELETPPECLPSGWAAVLYLYGLR